MISIEKPATQEDDPDMDCYQVYLIEDADQVDQDAQRLTNKVINIRKQGLRVEDIIDF